ncbi:acyl carrier protein [Nocardia fusca]|uniref:acyl carrier protein n=1 Tax=Nocardia fusca TaxID=941183 RepID=UPI00350E4B91
MTRTRGATDTAGRGPGTDTADGNGHRDQQRETGEAATTSEELEQYLVEHIARVMDLPPSEIDRDHPTNHLGLDSLMATDVRDRLRRDHGCAVTVPHPWKPTASANWPRSSAASCNEKPRSPTGHCDRNVMPSLRCEVPRPVGMPEPPFVVLDLRTAPLTRERE